MDKIYCLEEIVPYSCTKNKILCVESFLLFAPKVVKIAVPTKEIVILICHCYIIRFPCRTLHARTKRDATKRIVKHAPLLQVFYAFLFFQPYTTKPPPEGKAGVSERRRRTHEKVVVINLQPNCNLFDIICQ